MWVAWLKVRNFRCAWQISQVTAGELERAQRVLGIWCFCEHLRRKASLCFRGMYRVCNETREFPLPASVGMCKARDRSIEILFCCCVGRKMLAGLWFRDARLKELVGRLCVVFLEVWVVCEWLRRTWTLGFIEGNQCVVFSGPSLFGYIFTTKLKIGLKYEYFDDIESNIFFHFHFQIMMLQDISQISQKKFNNYF